MKLARFLTILFFTVFIFQVPTLSAQNPKEILRKAMDHLNGEYNQASIKMTIVRPSYTRVINLKSWSKGTDYSLILVTGPAREKGTAFLKREQEIWNWQPKIDRSIKLPPSMMMQAWMGSDFTNDDLVKQSSLEVDYTQKLLEDEEIDGRKAYQIELIPTEDAAVVWGKVIVWVDQLEYLQLKTEFYDEDFDLVSTMQGKNIETIGGKILPTTLELTPADEPENKTIITYTALNFKDEIPDSFFSLQNMKRVR